MPKLATIKMSRFLIFSILAVTISACSEIEIPDPVEPVIPITELNFEPETFRLEKEWKSKTVLLEYFVGSECPPCLAASLAVDGLLQTYDQKYLAVLEYHVQIPAPDPMENRYSHLRRFDYEVFRAPMTFFDGIEEFRGGGDETVAFEMYEAYNEHIKSILYAEPEIILSAASRIQEDSLVVVEINADRPVPGLTFKVALVENEVEYLGKNRIPINKMVVRDLQDVVLDDSGKGSHVFRLNAVDAIGKKWLRGIEENFAPFKFTEQKYLLNRNNLLVVFFAQDMETNKIYNSVVSEIRY